MISPAELGVLALAGYRTTQLVVHDSLLDQPRASVDHWYQQQPESRVRDAAVTLVSCVYCSGWWIAGILLTIWLLVTGEWEQAPVLVHGIEWAAVAGGAVLLNRWDDSHKEAS